MRQGYTLHYCIQLTFEHFIFCRYACAIPDPENEEVIITGGYVVPDVTDDFSTSTVSVYNEAGWQKDMTPLNQGRHFHACDSYVNGGKKVVDSDKT